LSDAVSAAADHTTLPVRAAPQRDCVGWHLANRNEIRVFGSDSYALLFLLFSLRQASLCVTQCLLYETAVRRCCRCRNYVRILACLLTASQGSTSFRVISVCYTFI